MFNLQCSIFDVQCSIFTAQSVMRRDLDFKDVRK
jgi:hypothetical protein